MPNLPPPWAIESAGSKNGACRLREEQAAGVTVEQILQGHSRARKQPPAQTHPVVVEQILSIRDHPAEGLRRVPGQEAIEYSLQRDPMLQFFQLPVPSEPRPFIAFSRSMTASLNTASCLSSQWSGLPL
jgi:hypothetical protein